MLKINISTLKIKTVWFVTTEISELPFKSVRMFDGIKKTYLKLKVNYE